MQQKTFPAFGYVVIRNEISAGELISDDLFTNGLVTITVPFSTCWFYTKGLVHNVNTETGEVSVRSPGFCNAVSKETTGVWRADFLEDSTVFCVPQPQGQKSPLIIDQLQPFVLLAGSSTTIAQGIKLLVCQGQLDIGGVAIPEFRQVEFKSGDKMVTAVQDVYGLIFP